MLTFMLITPVTLLMIIDHVHPPGLRHQLAVLLPQQRGAGGRQEPLESVEDGED